jgi:MFS family permease
MLSQVFNGLCLWTHRTGHIWLTVVVTDGDPFSVGLITALQFLPMMLSAVGGGLGDRWNKRLVLVVSQAVATVGALGLGVLSMTGSANLPLLGLMAVVLGMTAAADAPVRLAFPREIVEQQLLRSAIGLNGVVFQSARVVGPAVAGLLIVRWNESMGFFVAAGLGLVALLLLSLVSSTQGRSPQSGTDVRWRTTWGAIGREPALLSPLLGAVVVGACLSNLQVAVPLILDRMPSAGAGDFGLLVAMIGVGGAFGALAASVVRRGGDLRWLNFFLMGYALTTLAVAAMPTVVLMGIAMFATGLVMQLYNTNAITVLQDASPEGQHGRVMGVYVVAFFVWASFGAPLFGIAAGAFGPREMLATSSSACAAAGVLLLLTSPGSRATRSAATVPVDVKDCIRETP